MSRARQVRPITIKTAAWLLVGPAGLEPGVGVGDAVVDVVGVLMVLSGW